MPSFHQRRMRRVLGTVALDARDRPAHAAPVRARSERKVAGPAGEPVHEVVGGCGGLGAREDPEQEALLPLVGLGVAGVAGRRAQPRRVHLHAVLLGVARCALQIHRGAHRLDAVVVLLVAGTAGVPFVLRVQVLADAGRRGGVHVVVAARAARQRHLVHRLGHRVVAAQAAALDPGQALVRDRDALARHPLVLERRVAETTVLTPRAGELIRVAEAACLGSRRQRLPAGTMGVAPRAADRHRLGGAVAPVLERHGLEGHLGRSAVLVAARLRARAARHGRQLTVGQPALVALGARHRSVRVSRGPLRRVLRRAGGAGQRDARRARGASVEDNGP